MRCSPLKDVLGKDWYDRPERRKDEIVAVLLDNERDDDRIIARAVAEWGMTARGRRSQMLGVDLPAGYAHLSLKAIEKLLPHMERGLLYKAMTDPEQVRMHAAGYLRRDQLRGAIIRYPSRSGSRSPIARSAIFRTRLSSAR